MIRFLQHALLITGLFAGGLLHAEANARFDARHLAPNFDGAWAEIEVEAEQPDEPINPAAPRAAPEKEVVEATELSAAEIAILREAALKRSEKPEFALTNIYPSGEAVVFGVTENKAADIVILDNGLDQGFRVGMICEILRGDQLIGSIILVAVEADRSAGLILNLEPDHTITFGDLARIKTVQFS